MPWDQKWFFGNMNGMRQANGWAVVLVVCDEEEDPWYAKNGTMLADLEVQRTINRAELGGFHCGVVVFDLTSHNSHR